MMRKHTLLLIILMAGLVPSIALGGLIGEAAPPLTVKAWVRGEPVAVKAGTNLYVVEIWSTAGPASRASITNLNSLQQRFKTNGVIVVGVSDEPVETIEKFVQRDGTNINFAIAADEQRKTASSYMLSAGQRGVPYAFVVGTNGTVLWHGHPMRGLDRALDQIIAGRYDIEREKVIEIANHQMDQYLGLSQRRDSRAKPAGRVLLAKRTNDVALLCDMALQIATSPKADKPDYALAGDALDQAEKLAPTNNARVMITRAVLLFETGRRDEGLARARRAVGSAQNESDKTNAQAFLRTMEARLAAATNSQSNATQVSANAAATNGPPAKTNLTDNARTADPVPAANTNQNMIPVGKP